MNPNHHTPAPAGVRDLIEVKLENFVFGKFFFKMIGLDTFQPAGPEGARSRVPHADHLLADGAGTADRIQGFEVLKYRM